MRRVSVVIASLLSVALAAAGPALAQSKEPVKIGSVLTCTAWVLSGGARAAFVEAEVVDDEGRMVAKATSTYLLTPRDD